MPQVKGFRLNDELRAAFEEYCRAHLLDERAVIEAWLLRFLEATDAERKAVAERYTQWTREREARQAHDAPAVARKRKSGKGSP